MASLSHGVRSGPACPPSRPRLYGPSSDSFLPQAGFPATGSAVVTLAVTPVQDHPLCRQTGHGMTNPARGLARMRDRVRGMRGPLSVRAEILTHGWPQGALEERTSHDP